MATPPKKRRRPPAYMGEGVATRVALRFSRFHGAASAINLVFGVSGSDEFVGWLCSTIAFDGAEIRSQMLGPTAAEVRANLGRMSDETRQTAETLTAIGSREMRLLDKVASARGSHFEAYKVVRELRRVSELADEAKRLVKSNEGRKARPSALLKFGSEIAEKMRLAGTEPTSTTTGDFVNILRLAADSFNASWPDKPPIKISASEWARAVVSGKPCPR